MKRNILLFVLSALFLGNSALGQQPLSLKEAINYSLKNHGSNVIYANQQEIAKQQARQALSAYMPQVNTTVSFDNNLKRQTTVIPGSAFGATEDKKVQFGNKYNTNATLQLDQTIYDQAMIYGIKAGAPAQKIADLNKAKNDEELIYNTAVAYSQILILKEQQKLLAENEKQYQELYNITTLRFNKGVAKKVDIDRVQVNLNNIKAQQKQLQTDLEVAYNSLKNAMGVALTDTIAIQDSLDQQKYMLVANDDVNVKGRIEYQMQEQNILLQEIDVKRKQAASLPTVAAYARYGGQSFGNTINNGLANWGDYSAVGLKVSIPLFSGGRRASEVKQSKLELENAKQELDLDASQLQLQFQNASMQLQENMTNLNTNKNNMDLAESVYETSKFEYTKGVSSMSDLMNADMSFKQAQTNYITSLLNLVGNRLEYERAKGSIKEFVNQL